VSVSEDQSAYPESDLSPSSSSQRSSLLILIFQVGVPGRLPSCDISGVVPAVGSALISPERARRCFHCLWPWTLQRLQHLMIVWMLVGRGQGFKMFPSRSGTGRRIWNLFRVKVEKLIWWLCLHFRIFRHFYPKRLRNDIQASDLVKSWSESIWTSVKDTVCMLGDNHRLPQALVADTTWFSWEETWPSVARRSGHQSGHKGFWQSLLDGWLKRCCDGWTVWLE